MSNQTKVKSIVVPQQSVDLGSPHELAEFAKTLKSFVVQQGLYSKISDKNYVNVEGWQFAGASIGVFPVIKTVDRLETEKTEIKYRAEVELRRVSNDQIVGYGVAVCSNKEAKRKNADEYVIASMAQTRATGKAYRNAFAWLMKMAGFQPTPAEEMTEEEKAAEPKEEKKAEATTNHSAEQMQNRVEQMVAKKEASHAK